MPTLRPHPDTSKATPRVSDAHSAATSRVVDLAWAVHRAYNAPLTKDLLSAALQADELVFLQRQSELGLAEESPYAPLYEQPALLPYPPPP